MVIVSKTSEKILTELCLDELQEKCRSLERQVNDQNGFKMLLY